MEVSNILSTVSGGISRLSELGLRTLSSFRTDLLGAPAINRVSQNYFLGVLLSPADTAHKKPQNTEANWKGKTQNKSMQETNKVCGPLFEKLKLKFLVFEGMPLTQSRPMSWAHFVAVWLAQLSKLCAHTSVQCSVLESISALSYFLSLLLVAPKYNTCGYISYSK